MTEKEQELFYIGAAFYLDLDSGQVDRALGVAGMNVRDNTVAECRKAVRECYPAGYQRGLMGSPIQCYPPTRPAPDIQK